MNKCSAEYSADVLQYIKGCSYKVVLKIKTMPFRQSRIKYFLCHPTIQYIKGCSYKVVLKIKTMPFRQSRIKYFLCHPTMVEHIKFFRHALHFLICLVLPLQLVTIKLTWKNRPAIWDKLFTGLRKHFQKTFLELNLLLDDSSWCSNENVTSNIFSLVYNWKNEDVLIWIKVTVGLPQYEKIFREKNIDGKSIPR